MSDRPSRVLWETEFSFYWGDTLHVHHVVITTTSTPAEVANETCFTLFLVAVLLWVLW
jgi:hypothetical protein